MSKEIIPLTAEQQDFAAKHHDLIYRYLKMRNFTVDECYDVAVFGYLRAVRRYLTRPDLQEKYEFFTIAKRAMKGELHRHFNRLGNRAEKMPLMPYEDTADTAADVCGKVVSIDSARELMRQLTAKQTRIASLIADGHSIAQVGCICGIKSGDVRRELAKARGAILQFAPDMQDSLAA